MSITAAARASRTGGIGHAHPARPAASSRTSLTFGVFLLTTLLSALLPALPLLIAGASLLTELRSRKGMQAVIWILAGLLTALQATMLLPPTLIVETSTSVVPLP
ncbi:hypothetical protein MUN78_13210 [Leucobacter allii]|uniref:Energy-coupling factor transporter transmembrane protein EcfT n=1 Tax=Leucobacter allii TaxID=2932247 RepID=A0ABY4FK64_9MICO|nr:hypothetical protein [Leucobacter allii]UOQ56624.1 hypothetical protein MUN78_13210 [Leucobacter allii]